MISAPRAPTEMTVVTATTATTATTSDASEQANRTGELQQAAAEKEVFEANAEEAKNKETHEFESDQRAGKWQQAASSELFLCAHSCRHSAGP